MAFARKRMISSVVAASKSRARTLTSSVWCRSYGAHASGRGFYKDVGPTGLRSRLPVRGPPAFTIAGSPAQFQLRIQPSFDGRNTGAEICAGRHIHVLGIVR